MERAPPPRWRNVEVVPLVHGRIAFAVEVRERMLAKRHAALAVELPPSLKERVFEGIGLLPRIHAVVYRDWTLRDVVGEPWSPERERRGEDDDVSAATDERAWYVPIDPCDAIVEALRIARGERIPVHFVDAEVEEFEGRRMVVPDPHALLTLGLERYFAAALPAVRRDNPATAEDLARERHMAARVAQIARAAEQAGRGDVLFLCGLAHWERIREHLEAGTGAPERGGEGGGPAPEDVALVPVHPASLFHLLGEIPFVAWAWERHRGSIDLSRHDQILAVKELLLAARQLYDKENRNSLERATPAALSTLLDFLRKLVVGRGRLVPDLYSLVVAAKGVVGNDFALALLHVAKSYPPNQLAGEGAGDAAREQPGAAAGGQPGDAAGEGEAAESSFLFESAGELARIGGDFARVTPRAPGDWRTLKRVKLVDRPPKADRELWRSVWNPYASCSWPPEDVVIENLRAYVSSRTLALAGIDRVRTEEFAASLKDGLAVRETLRDLPLSKIHVKVEPRVPGKVGAVVLVFEEDDDGARYPLRMTWMAEHRQESTLAFYATNFLDDMVGPGIGRARYGGCMFLFPPIPIPDVWDDLRFEKARRPSERLLLAALFHARDRFVAYVAEKPPRPEALETARRLRRHVVHLPLSSFSSRTLEKLRRFHVLNGRVVRSWAARFIR